MPPKMENTNVPLFVHFLGLFSLVLKAFVLFCVTLLVHFFGDVSATFGEKWHKSGTKVSLSNPLLVKSGTKVAQKCHLQNPLLVKSGTKVAQKCHLQNPLLVKSGTKVA